MVWERWWNTMSGMLSRARDRLVARFPEGPALRSPDEYEREIKRLSQTSGGFARTGSRPRNANTSTSGRSTSSSDRFGSGSAAASSPQAFSPTL